VLCSLLWVTLLRQGVGLGDPQRALPAPTILWFCDSSISSAGRPMWNGGPMWKTGPVWPQRGSSRTGMQKLMPVSRPWTRCTAILGPWKASTPTAATSQVQEATHGAGLTMW